MDATIVKQVVESDLMTQAEEQEEGRRRELG